jgi:hypothetical protein
MKNVLYIALGFAFALVVFFCSAYVFVGKSTILDHSAKIKPYSHIFKTGALINARKPKPDILVLFLGDSSVAQPPWADSDAPHIPAVLESLLRETAPDGQNISVIEWSFPGGRPFHYYCLLFEAEKYSPCLLVIPINWRILGPSSEYWDTKFAFAELCASVPLSERSQRSGSSVMELEGISIQRQLAHMFFHPMLYVTGMKLWLQSNLGMQAEEEAWGPLQLIAPDPGELISSFSDTRLFRQYTNHVTANNAQLKTLHAIAETSARRGIKVLFYITPIHMDEMRARASFDKEGFRHSIELVTQSVRSESSRCLDLSGLLGADDFIDYFEHYTPEGNQQIALALAPEVTELVESSLVHAALQISLTKGKDDF